MAVQFDLEEDEVPLFQLMYRDKRGLWDEAVYRGGIGFDETLTGFLNQQHAEDKLAWFKARHGPAYHAWIKEISDEYFWRQREQGRFDNKTYDKVPWANEVWAGKYPDHFLHMSVEHPGKVAFTPDAKKGAADRQVVVNPGRYLTKFFSDVITPKDIERWAAAVSVAGGAYVLKVTQDAKEIASIYRNGPYSCMAGNHNIDGHHPAEVYAGPDLALAYLGTPEKPTARCVVWPEKKRYSTIYGDIEKMRLLLTAAGYVERSLERARIQRIEVHGDSVLMPYLDCARWARDDGEFLVIGAGDIVTNEQNGYSRIFNWTCPNCGNGDDEDEACFVEDAGEEWCDSCCAYTWTDGGDTRWSDAEMPVEVYSVDGTGHIISENWTDQVAGEIGTYIPSRNEYWMDEDVFECGQCSENFVIGERFDEGGPSICKTCCEAQPKLELVA